MSKIEQLADEITSLAAHMTAAMARWLRSRAVDVVLQVSAAQRE